MKATECSTKRVAIYARVSSEQQAQDQTIVSQVEALRQRVLVDGFELSDELCFLDNGASGSPIQNTPHLFFDLEQAFGDFCVTAHRVEAPNI